MQLSYLETTNGNSCRKFSFCKNLHDSFLDLDFFFGQCSEICGANHRFIPIKLEVVPI